MAFPPNPLPEAAPELLSPTVAPETRPENPPWNGWDVLLAFALLFACTLVFVVINVWFLRRGGLLRHVAPADMVKDPLLILPAELLAYMVMLIFVYLTAMRAGSRSFWDALRWNWPRRVWATYPALGVLLAVSVQVFSKFVPIPKSLPMDEYFRSPMDAYTMGLFAVLVAPFMEELLFRGLLYPVIARAAGVGFGIVVTGLLFAVMHASQLGWSWGPVLILFAVGAVLTTIRAVTKSVASSMLTHMGYNLTLFSVFFVGTGHFQHMERLSR